MSRNDSQFAGERAGQWGPRYVANLDPNRQWAALRRRYEWNDENEDGVAPVDKELENDLFGEDNHIHTGINFQKYDKIKVKVDNNTIKPISTFDEAELHSAMKDNVKLAKYIVPTPVQKYSIPIITNGLDLMACAQTGSGKTAAFLIPILSKVFTAKRAPRQTGSSRRYKAEPLVLIIAPTRELATQIFDECRRFTYRSMMRPCVVYGGADSMSQKNELAKGCDILAATPGRLNDFIDRGALSLRKVRYLVLDEADRMLDMGFESEIRKIVQQSDLLDDGSRQTMMFSATFPSKIQEIASEFLKKDHVFLTVGRVGGTTSDITQKIQYVEEKGKRSALVELLLKQPPSRTLIFVETKRGADSLDDYLFQHNFPTTSIHGDRTQREREDALISFKNGKSPILIATAVAARGLDIKNIMHVINYDLCNDIDEYVHRIGRTARVGNEGLATTFYNEKNSDISPDLVKLLMESNQEVPDFLQSYAPGSFDDFNNNNKSSGSGSYRNNNNRIQNDNQTTQQDNSWGNNNNISTSTSTSEPTWNPDKKPWDDITTPQIQQQLLPPLQPQQISHQPPPPQQQQQQQPQQQQLQQPQFPQYQNTQQISHQPPLPPMQQQPQFPQYQNSLPPQDLWSSPSTLVAPTPQQPPFQQQQLLSNLQPPLQPFQQQPPQQQQQQQQSNLQPQQSQYIQPQYNPQPQQTYWNQNQSFQ